MVQLASKLTTEGRGVVLTVEEPPLELPWEVPEQITQLALLVSVRRF